MNYSMKLIKKRWKANRKSHVRLIIQFMICFILLNFFTTAWLQLVKEEKQEEKKTGLTTFSIQPELKDPSLYEPPSRDVDPPFTANDIDQLTSDPIVETDFINTRLIANFAAGLNGDYKQIARTKYKEIQMTKKYEEMILHWKEQKKDIANAYTVPVEKINTLKWRTISGEEPVCYMPFDLIENYKAEDISQTKLELRFKTGDLQKITHQMTSMIEDLEKRNPSYTYKVDQKLYEFLNLRGSIKKSADLMKYISIAILIISMFSMMGMILLITQRRQKEMAVFLALGMKKSTVLLELFGEVVLLLILSSLLGGLITQLSLMKGMAYLGVRVFMNLRVFFGYFFFSMLLGIGAILPSTYFISKLPIIELLRGNE